jgi:uncharacterized membrane protein SirB2
MIYLALLMLFTLGLLLVSLTAIVAWLEFGEWLTEKFQSAIGDIVPI